ncbi:MAG: AAA family ATPase, partial [Pseudoflavonifractor sp.]
MSYRPLADEIRPNSLEEVVGQRHILGEGGLLRRIIESGNLPNLVFYGPSGVGKTTVANIIAARTNRSLRRLNATTASLSDIKDVIADVGTMLAPNGILLYLDEIQYFNKKQQQSLLEVIESGDVTLIASTTENPYFYIYNAVLSRSTVFEFKTITAEDILPAVDRGVRFMEARLGEKVKLEKGVAEHIASACGGDVRKALNAVELLMNSATRGKGKPLVTLEDAKAAAQRSAMRYDREGDDHYDILSALQKSIRGSDPDAALHYLARLLEAGDLISACRRLMVIASEDVGLAYPQAVTIVKSCIDAANMLGLPEARIPLAQAAVLM